jgi:hypothetical protein
VAGGHRLRRPTASSRQLQGPAIPSAGGPWIPDTHTDPHCTPLSHARGLCLGRGGLCLSMSGLYAGWWGSPSPPRQQKCGHRITAKRIQFHPSGPIAGRPQNSWACSSGRKHATLVPQRGMCCAHVAGQGHAPVKGFPNTRALAPTDAGSAGVRCGCFAHGPQKYGHVIMSDAPDKAGQRGQPTAGG